MSQFKSVTLGVQGDIGGILTGQGGIGYAFSIGNKEEIELEADRKKAEIECWYFNYAAGVGMAIGGSIGIEIGFWESYPADLKGSYWGIELAAGLGVGVGIGIYFNNEFIAEKLDFAGFSIVVGLATEIELNYVFDGETFVFTKEGIGHMKEVLEAN